MDSIFLILDRALGLALCAGAVFVFVSVVRMARLGRASRAWPSVKGTIISSEIRSDYFPFRGRFYQPAITHRYWVSGRVFESDSISTRSIGGSEEAAQAVVNRYPPGETVDVFYVPSAPSNAVLERGLDYRFYAVGAFVSAVLFSVGAWLAWTGG